MIYFGTFSVIAAVYILWRTYCSYLCSELSDARTFLAALSDYREKMRCYLSSPRAWASDYSDERLGDSGFLSRLASGEEMTYVFRELREEYYLTDRVNEILNSCFDRLGEGYLDTELEVLASAIAALGEEVRSMSDELKNRERVAGALLGAFAVGTVILIM